MANVEQDSSHRNSVAWQKGMELARLVYKTTRHFPADERFGLTNQLRRASVSIPSNIAERKGRLTTGEFIQFLGIARGSTLEVQTQLELASDFGFGDPVEIAAAQALVSEQLRILNASLATLRAKVAARKQH
ncbi:MAG TPA: four helix bundle protein [Acidobacteriaceae bacterium]